MAQSSKDPKVLSKFIKDNPNDPRVNEIRDRFTYIVSRKVDLDDSNQRTDYEFSDNRTRYFKRPRSRRKSKEREALPLANVKKSKKSEKSSSSSRPTNSTTASSDESAAILNHIFSDDANKTEALFEVINKSKCPMTVKIEGRKRYSLTIMPQQTNRILLPKGTYNLSSTVCDNYYSAKRKLYEDLTIEFGGE